MLKIKKTAENLLFFKYLASPTRLELVSKVSETFVLTG